MAGRGTGIVVEDHLFPHVLQILLHRLRGATGQIHHRALILRGANSHHVPIGHGLAPCGNQARPSAVGGNGVAIHPFLLAVEHLCAQFLGVGAQKFAPVIPTGHGEPNSRQGARPLLQILTVTAKHHVLPRGSLHGQGSHAGGKGAVLQAAFQGTLILPGKGQTVLVAEAKNHPPQAFPHLHGNSQIQPVAFHRKGGYPREAFPQAVHLSPAFLHAAGQHLGVKLRRRGGRMEDSHGKGLLGRHQGSAQAGAEHPIQNSTLPGDPLLVKQPARHPAEGKATLAAVMIHPHPAFDLGAAGQDRALFQHRILPDDTALGNNTVLPHYNASAEDAVFHHSPLFHGDAVMQHAFLHPCLGVDHTFLPHHRLPAGKGHVTAVIGLGGADVEPHSLRHLPVDGNAFLQKGGEEILAEIVLHPRGDALQKAFLQNIDPRGDEIGEGVPPGGLFQKAADLPAGEGDDAELPGGPGMLQQDGGLPSFLFVPFHGGTQIKIRHRVPGDHQKGILQQVCDGLDASPAAQRKLPLYHGEGEVGVFVAVKAFRQGAYRHRHGGDALLFQKGGDPRDHRHSRHGHQGLWQGVGNGSETAPHASCQDHCLVQKCFLFHLFRVLSPFFLIVRGKRESNSKKRGKFPCKSGKTMVFCV